MGTFVAILLGEIVGGAGDRDQARRPDARRRDRDRDRRRRLPGQPRHSDDARGRAGTARSTGTRSPRPGAICASRTAIVSSGCRCSAFRGSGSTARPISRSSPTSPRTSWAATSTSPRCCWRSSRSASASARCCASACPDTRSRSDWCRSARSACRCSRSTCISPAAVLQPQGLAGIGHFLSVGAHWRIVADLVLLGMFGGFYIVPLYALIQERSEPAYRSRIIAANNILNALFMVASAGIALGLLKAGLDHPAAVPGHRAHERHRRASTSTTLVPEFLMRFLAWLLIHSIYRVDKQGLEQIPDQGACVIVCNHVSYVDAIVIAACVRRPDALRDGPPHLHACRCSTSSSAPCARFRSRRPRKMPRSRSGRSTEAANALKAGEIVVHLSRGQDHRHGRVESASGPGCSAFSSRRRCRWCRWRCAACGAAFSAVPPGARPCVGCAGFSPRSRWSWEPPLAPAQATPERLQETVFALRGDWR